MFPLLRENSRPNGRRTFFLAIRFELSFGFRPVSIPPRFSIARYTPPSNLSHPRTAHATALCGNGGDGRVLPPASAVESDNFNECLYPIKNCCGRQVFSSLAYFYRMAGKGISKCSFTPASYPCAVTATTLRTEQEPRTCRASQSSVQPCETSCRTSSPSGAT